MKKLFLVIMVLDLCFVLSTNVLATQKTLTIVSQPDTLMTNQWVYGPRYIYTPMGDTDWGNAKPTVLVYDTRWGIPIPTATWISTSDPIEENQVDSWRLFHAKMNIACTAYNITGSVVVTSDNAEEFYFNGLYIGTDGEVQVPYTDNGEWRTPVEYETIIPQAGANTLDFIVRNYPPWYPTASCCYMPGEPNPTGLIFKATVNYELPDVVWQPPLTNESFELKDGTTMPFKFKLHTQVGDLIIDQMNVYLKVFGPSDGGIGDEVAAFWPGEGGDFLRFDLYESYYIGNFRTKDYGLTDGETYTAVVFDACTDEVLGTYTFLVSAGKGNRANKN